MKELSRGETGEPVRSGILTEATKMTFRSRSARIFWLVQMSHEMWDYAHDGEVYYEKFLAFVRILLDNWRALDVSHSLSVVFFTRMFYYRHDHDHDQDLDRPSPGGPPAAPASPSSSPPQGPSPTVRVWYMRQRSASALLAPPLTPRHTDFFQTPTTTHAQQASPPSASPPLPPFLRSPQQRQQAATDAALLGQGYDSGGGGGDSGVAPPAPSSSAPSSSSSSAPRRPAAPSSGSGSTGMGGGVCVDGEGRLYQDFFKMVLENESRTDTPNATGTHATHGGTPHRGFR